MKRQVKTDREIADLIASAYEGLTAPDARRLVAIEQRLLEQPRLRGRAKFAWWWLAGALLTGAASALWWAVDYDSDEKPEESAPVITSPSTAPSEAGKPTRPDRSESTEPMPADGPAQKQGPMIYQRER
jgi:hypothetical protein